MRMIPTQPLNTESRAELQVFDQLRAAFSAPEYQSWFALHSLNLPWHEYKRFAEIDFVVAGPQGIYVLEVKGGGVSCCDGIWQTTNRRGDTVRLRESPFKQAQSAMHGLQQRLPAALASVFTIGYGVVIPDTQRLPESAEWERAVLADGRDFQSFEHWLHQLIKHWQTKAAHAKCATVAQLDELQQHLRPDFEAVALLPESTHAVEERIARLTANQLKLVDIVEANSRVICSGGAGTGKTMMALELAKRWRARDMTVALVCQSPWLKRFLERNAVAGLSISLVDGIRVAARRAGVDKFDALIVDEGQDILNMDALTQLGDYLHGGISEGRWCFFHDLNNQSGLCGTYLPEAYEYLERTRPAQVPLTTNCRNALPILQHIQSQLGADLGHSGVGGGPEVRICSAENSCDASHKLEQELRALLERDGYSPGDIVLLSSVPFAQSCASSIGSTFQQLITVLDESSARYTNRSGIGFAKIEQFKGLESEVVIVVDLEPPEDTVTPHALHYVGMSRARALLSLIYSRRSLD
jgi:putative intracellular protease/amidase